MNFFLDVEQLRVHHEIAPITLILRAPCELRIEIVISTLARHANRTVRRFVDHIECSEVEMFSRFASLRRARLSASRCQPPRYPSKPLPDSPPRAESGL